MLTVMAFMLFAQASASGSATTDWELTQETIRLERQVGMDYYTQVVIVPEWGEQGIVQAKTFPRGEYIIIAVSPIILQDLDRDAQRGMLAHELAHLRRTCGLKEYASEREELVCEHAADAQAARWVGKRTVIRGLCQLIASSWVWRYRTDLSILITRIKMLHDRRDIT